MRISCFILEGNLLFSSDEELLTKTAVNIKISIHVEFTNKKM